MRHHRSLTGLIVAAMLGASLALSSAPAQAAPIRSDQGSSTTVSTEGFYSMGCYWFPFMCR